MYSSDYSETVEAEWENIAEEFKASGTYLSIQKPVHMPLFSYSNGLGVSAPN